MDSSFRATFDGTLRTSSLPTEPITSVLSHEKVRLGDTCYVVMPDISPLAARVIRIERRRKDPGQTNIELGNFRPVRGDKINDIERRQKRSDARSGVWDRAAAFDVDGRLKTSALDGVIDAVQNQIKAGGGEVLIDEEGFRIMDTDDPATALSKIHGVARDGEAALVIGKRDSVLDAWEERVGMTSSGFRVFGEEIVGGLISADRIKVGVGTTFATGYDPSEKETPDGAQEKAIAAGAAAKAYADEQVLAVKGYADNILEALANGEFLGGTFIDGMTIYSPIIAGMEGRFTGELKVGTGNNLAGISGDGSAAGSIRFWAGHATKTQAPFRVTQDGSLYASKATITGTINATGGTFSGNISVTGTISGGTISGATITGGSIDISSGQFRVTSTGRLTARNVDIRGYIDATSGYFEEVEIYSARFRGDGVYNDYGGAARWKRSDSVYLSQSDSDFGVRFSGGTMFASRSNGRVEALHGKMYAEGFEQYSSRELKKNIVPLEKSALSMISAIPIYEYEFKKEATLSSKKHIGPMAEDMPETMTDEVLRENKTFKTISISDMVGLLWKAVQELSEKVDGLGGAKE